MTPPAVGGTEFAALFRRDLARVVRQADALPDELLWRTLPGVTNSAGHLLLHLNGNLREYIGRQLGGVPYQRDRPREFGATDIPKSAVLSALSELPALIPGILDGLTPAQWEATFPENVLGEPLSTRHFVAHLYGHLNYHLGQIDYLRRVLTGDGALARPAQ